MPIRPNKYRALREAKGLTQHQLATAAGLASQSAVSNIERGLRPSPEVERRLREVLEPGRDGAVSAPQKVKVSDA
jgi:transcriptional regulator with XRE-family HTH domain